MMDYSAGLPGLGRRSVERTLEALNDLRLKSQGLGPSARPLLALHLRGGVTAEGWLLDFGPAESGSDKDPVVVLHRAWPSSQQPAEAAFYVGLREIQAITIFEAADAARHLLPPPSKMDLRRLADEAAKVISAQTGKTVSAQHAFDSLSEESFPVVGDQLRALKAAVSDILADGAGRDAFKEKVSSLSFKTAKEGAAQLSGGTLAVTLSLGKALSSAALKKSIEDIL